MKLLHSDNRRVTAQLPSWLTTPPTYGSVVLRAFTDEDAHLAVELGDDPYVPFIGSPPAHPTAEQALAWIHRQRGRLAEGTGLSFVIADAESGNAVGAIGLSLRDLPAGRATAGLDHPRPVPGRAVHRAVEHQLHPCRGSVRLPAGGLLRSHQEIGGTRRDMLLYAATRP